MQLKIQIAVYVAIGMGLIGFIVIWIAVKLINSISNDDSEYIKGEYKQDDSRLDTRPEDSSTDDVSERQNGCGLGQYCREFYKKAVTILFRIFGESLERHQNSKEGRKEFARNIQSRSKQKNEGRPDTMQQASGRMTINPLRVDFIPKEDRKNVVCCICNKEAVAWLIVTVEGFAMCKYHLKMLHEFSASTMDIIMKEDEDIMNV